MTLEEYKRRLGANAHKALDILDRFFNTAVEPLAGQPDTNEILDAWDTICFAVNFAYTEGEGM